MIIEELFCLVDDFCKEFIPNWERKLIQSRAKMRLRATNLSTSEVMTILIWYHQTHYRDFKSYYYLHSKELKQAFPNLVSYNRFVELLPRIIIPMCVLLKGCLGKPTGISYIDSTPLAVCSNKRIKTHRVFDGVATLGKTTKGWFFGFKLHLICNHRGELISVKLTPGNVDDREPVLTLVKNVFGKLFGDKGYISTSLCKNLINLGIQLFTGIRKNMKNKFLSMFDKILLKKRSVIESVINQLKNVFQIEHSRHRSPINAFVHLIGSLIAYCKYPNKASIRIQELDKLALNT